MSVRLEPIGPGVAVVGAIGAEDAEGAIGEQLDLPLAFVDSVVMPRTQRHEVVEVGGPAVDPLVDVVGLAP